MKDMRKILLMFAAFLPVVSCSDAYEPGQEDMPECPDFYFTTGQSGHFAFDQTEDIELSFTVERPDPGESVVVPLEVHGPEGVIDVTPLMFLDGETVSEIRVTAFGLDELQKEYEFTISIPAPEYAPLYGLNETSVTFSIIREDYERKGSGTFNSEVLGSTRRNVIYEYSESLDMYRIVSPYGTEGNILFKWDGSENVEFEADASFFVAQIVDPSGAAYYTYGEPESGSYDSETMTFTFNIWYGVPSEGDTAGFGYSEDTFELND